MEPGDREGIHLLVDDGMVTSSSPLCQCRICHEEEEMESTTMESPCACSGSLKFVHRGCIQRWCDEKGSTVCEICLQKFEPGYTIPPKVSQLVDVVVTIRGSLEVPRRNYQPQTLDSDDGSDYDYPECSPTTERGSSCFRSLIILVTIMLLVRHLIAVITVGSDHYVFALATVFVLRASGIILPFYLVMRLIVAIQHAQWQQRRRLQLHLSTEETTNSLAEGEEDVEMQQHRIQIHS